MVRIIFAIVAKLGNKEPIRNLNLIDIDTIDSI